MQLFRLAILAGAVVLSSACLHAKPPEPVALPEETPVRLEGELLVSAVKAGESTLDVSRLVISAPRNPRSGRPPVNLALLIDTSGSMEGKPIADARAASLSVLDALAPDDTLSVTVFHSKADVLLPATTLREADLGAVRNKLMSMKAQGTTDMGSGLDAAYAEVTKRINRAGVNRIVLLGDGVPNDATRVLPLVQQAAQSGVSVTALGLGPDYNETLMGQIAQASGGRFHYVADSSKVAAFFRDEVVRMQTVVARNAYLELLPGPGSRVESVMGQGKGALPAGRVTVPVGDISLGDARDVVVKWAVGPHKDGQNVELGDAVLHWTEDGRPVERRYYFGARATKDAAKLSDRNAAVEKAIERAEEAARILEQIEKDRAIETRKQQGGPTKPERGAGPAKAPPGARPATTAPAPAEVTSPAPPAASPVTFRSAEEMRRAHDEAMQVVQGYH
jgi:Ca-activated chloride channel family protein